VQALAEWLVGATETDSRDSADSDVAESSKQVADLTRQEEIKLVQRLFLTSASDAPRAVLFAGVEDDNGCAHVCLRVSETLARLTHRSVCVVDADVRAPKLHGLVGRARDLVGAGVGEGLAASMTSPVATSAFARPLAPDNLWLVSAETATEVDPFENVDRMRACLQELGARFEHVVISTSTIDFGAESMALSRFVDGVVLVLKAHVTRREIVRNVLARLEDLHIPLLGVVLNDRTFPIPEAVYKLI
jgi:receptor protein-tyrosine kinase